MNADTFNSIRNVYLTAAAQYDAIDAAIDWDAADDNPAEIAQWERAGDALDAAGNALIDATFARLETVNGGLPSELDIIRNRPAGSIGGGIRTRLLSLAERLAA